MTKVLAASFVLEAVVGWELMGYFAPAGVGSAEAVIAPAEAAQMTEEDVPVGAGIEEGGDVGVPEPGGVADFEGGCGVSGGATARAGRSVSRVGVVEWCVVRGGGHR